MVQYKNLLFPRVDQYHPKPKQKGSHSPESFQTTLQDKLRYPLQLIIKYAITWKQYLRTFDVIPSHVRQIGTLFWYKYNGAYFEIP